MHIGQLWAGYHTGHVTLRHFNRISDLLKIIAKYMQPTSPYLLCYIVNCVGNYGFSTLTLKDLVEVSPPPTPPHIHFWLSLFHDS